MNRLQSSIHARQIREAFEEVIDLPHDSRAPYLDQNFEENPSLREEIEALLDAYDEADEVLHRLEWPITTAESLPSDHRNLSGQRLSQYEVLEKIGGGGMGVVYKARDVKLDRLVALKFLPPHLSTDEEAKKRFLHEARAASALDHPNICTIHEIGETDEGQLFIAMAYCDGETLKDVIARGFLPIEEAVGYAIQIAQGLACAHEAGIVHRDVKPANVMVSDRGHVKLVDFGLAKGSSVNLTQTGMTLGTVAYMSPEQLQGRDVDARSDLFSFGIVFYEMLTGHHPFPGEYEQAVAYRIVNEDPPLPRSFRSEFPLELQDIIHRCLAKDREQRYASTQDLLRDLQGNEKEATPSGPARVHRQRLSSKLRTFSPLVTRRTAVIGLVVFAALLLLFTRLLGGAIQEPLPDEKHIVVLPFTILTEETIPEALNEGLVEMLTSKITQIEPDESSFWVVPSSEVRQEQVASVADASRLFGANLVVTGSLQRTGDRFQMTMNLVDGSTRRQLRSELIDVEWTDFARLPDAVVRALSSMLEVEMSPRTADRSDDPRAYQLYIEGRGHLSRFEDLAKVEAAIRKFEESVEVDPTFVHAYAALGEAYWRKYDLTHDPEWTQAALQYGHRAIELNDRIPEVHTTMALIYNGMGRYDEALRMLERLGEHDRTRSAALNEFARAYEGQGRLDLAEEAYQNAVAQRRTYWGAHATLGRFYYGQGRFSEAAAAFSKVTELTPDNIRGYSNLGAAYFQMGQYELARITFQRSLVIQPNYIALSNLGTLAFYEEQYIDAIRLYEEALGLGEGDYEVWGNLGAAYYWSGGDTEKANTALERAIALAEQAREIMPNNPRLLVQLAGYHALLGNQEEAHTLLDHVATLEALEPESMAMAAHIYEQMGARDTALHWLEDALEKGYQLNSLERLPGMDDLLADARMMQLRERYE